MARDKEIGEIDHLAVGRRLRDIRKRRGWSQAAVAAKVGLTQTLVSDYEIGRLRLHASLLIRFAKAFHVTADEILGLKAGDTNDTALDRRFLRRLEQIGKLSKDEKLVLLKTIDHFLRGAQSARPVPHQSGR